MVKRDGGHYMCFACGFEGLSEPARGVGGSAHYQICGSCTFEEGWSDDDQGFSFAHWRDIWLARGARWESRRPQPDDWDATAQLARLPTQDWTWRPGDIVEIPVRKSDPAYATIEWIHPRNYYLRLTGSLVAAYGDCADLEDPRFSVVTLDTYLVHGFWRVVGRTDKPIDETPSGPHHIEPNKALTALTEAAAGVRQWAPSFERMVVRPLHNRSAQ
jgi:hypothetical protein